MADMTGQSRAAIASELLETALPILQRTARLLAAAQAAREATKGQLRENLEAAESRLQGMLGEAMAEFDLAEIALTGGPAASPDGDLPGRRRPRSTPMSNRGVTTPTHPTPNPLKGRARPRKEGRS